MRISLSLMIGLAALSCLVQADESATRPWMNSALDADRRAELVVAALTREEKQTLVFGYFATEAPWKKFTPPAEAREGSAGYVAGIPRLGIPAQWQTDAGLGVATQGGAKRRRERTALPSGLATAATWDPELARRAGAMIGSEARNSGFNVLLGGSVNLVREPRNGRNFEYAGEDPLLAGVMVGAQIAGVESNHVISTLKHFALNDQETDRNKANVIIDRAQAHLSDLLAFRIAIEQSNPGSVMCSYNKVWGDHACESAYLLTDVLRKDWGWQGYVMSDWGATHSTTKAALAGLEQQSGNPFDDIPHFGKPLLKAVESGELPEARLNQMVQRILRTMFVKGVIDHPVAVTAIDAEANARVSREGAEQGAVLLKNDGAVLPLKAGAARIVLIGGHADKGVLAGGGSSLVYPAGGNAVPGLKPTSWPGPVMYYPSSPMRAIQALAPGAKVEFDSGHDRAAAAKLAAGADVALVFVTQWTTESEDASLELVDEQDALVAAVAAANPRTVVIVQSGGAVFMPWLGKVQGVLQAWYTGTRGGEAIANVLFGKVNPSGRLPISFPKDSGQFARASLVEKDAAGKPTGEIHYKEGATVGYKWFDAHQQQPLFPFGFGLSYTQFEYGDFKASVDGRTVTISFKVRNTGKVAGQDVPQVYVSNPANYWEAPKRLGGWKKVSLTPGASTAVELKVDPRLLAVFDATSNTWKLRKGTYEILLGSSSRDLPQRARVQMVADDEWR